MTDYQLVTINTQVETGHFVHNLAEVKASVKLALKKYTGLVYTDENIKEAIEDKNTLSRMIGAAEEQRKALKAEYDAPYLAFKSDYDEVVGLVKTAYNEIYKQVTDFDKRQADARESKIREIIEQSFESYKDNADKVSVLRKTLEINPKWWTNKSSDPKKVKVEIQEQNEKHARDLDTILTFIGTELETLPQLIEVYIRTKDVGAVISEKNRIIEQRQETLNLAIEKKKREEEQKRLAEITKVAEPQQAEQQVEELKATNFVYSLTLKISHTDKEFIGDLGNWLRINGFKIHTIEKPHKEVING